MAQISCSNCGATIDTSDRTCPYCSTAIQTPDEALPPTVRIDRDLFSGNMHVNAADSENFREVRELVAQGNKIEAIKVYREITGVGLKEAKDAVEALERGQPVIVPADATIVSGAGMTVAALRNFQSSAEAMDAVKKEIRNGNKLKAIQLHREYFGTSLADSKTAVEQMETDMNLQAAPPDTEPPAFARPDEPAISANPFDEPQKPSNTRKWVIGCSIAAVLFLCLCVCLPIVLFIFSGQPQ